MRKIILASQSKSRIKLLKVLGYPFKVVVSNFNESLISEPNPKLRVAKIARGKGEKVAMMNDGVVVAADTYSLCKGNIMEKPRSIQEAKEMLYKLSESKVVGYTGFYYLDKSLSIENSDTVETEVQFRKLYKEEIERYVTKYPVTSWAAAYAPSELYVLTMIKSIKGSLTGWAYGLPTELLIPLLETSGFKPNLNI